MDKTSRPTVVLQPPDQGFSVSLLTRGVVGHVCSHWVWPWPSLVNHAMHAVHARAVWRACSHHTLGHVRVARWSREENACLKRTLRKLINN